MQTINIAIIGLSKHVRYEAHQFYLEHKDNIVKASTQHDIYSIIGLNNEIRLIPCSNVKRLYGIKFDGYINIYKVANFLKIIDFFTINNIKQVSFHDVAKKL